MKEEKEEIKQERSSGSANTKSKLPLSSLYRVVEFLAILSPSNQLSLPVIYPLAASPIPLLPRRPPHVKVNNTPTFCAPRRVRFLSKWIHDKFLFRGLNARARASRFSLSLSLCHPSPPLPSSSRPRTVALSHFLVSRWDTQPC